MVIAGCGSGLPEGWEDASQLDGVSSECDSVDDPDVVVTTDSTTFMLLAGGRIDAEAAIADGAITWAGDDEWGAKAARSLRYTR